MIEADRAARYIEMLGAGPVGDLGILIEHFHHALDVGQPLLDLAVDHAHEVQRHEELQHQEVHHREVADGIDCRRERRSRPSPGRSSDATVKITAWPEFKTASEV